MEILNIDILDRLNNVNNINKEENNIEDNVEFTIKHIVNSAINCGKYVRNHIDETHEINSKCITLICITIINYSNLYEEWLYKYLNKEEIVAYSNTISFFNGIIHSYNLINKINLIKGYDKYHAKSLDNMSKDELLEYIKQHNIK